MNFRSLLLPALAALALGFPGSSASAAATNVLVATRNPNAKTPAAKPAAAEPAAVALVPQSIFVIPRQAADGKDPFFPNSTRVYGAETAVKAATSPGVVADMTLKGISGTPEQPLAIINTTTFTTGESSEVILKNGRLRVQCLEINMAAGTVLLQIGSERRELRLAPAK